MKKIILNFLTITFVIAALDFSCAADYTNASAQEIIISHTGIFGQPPIPISLDGFSGEAAEVLKFDLFVQGFSFTTPDAAQYLIHGSGAGDVAGTLTDKFAKKVLLSRSYNGASVRRQAHAFADDIVLATTGKKGIGQTKIAYKSQPTGIGTGEIFVADFDGHGAQAVTSDKAIATHPAWVPGHMAIFYTSYARGNPDIFYHNLSSRQRLVVAGYSGLNTSASVSPDGTKVAMILSKSGSPNVWVANLDGTNLKKLTSGLEDSSPCWSNDGSSICYATKTKGQERRRLAKISASGGEPQFLNTSGVSSPTEPDWSPDGKWIAFTRQAGAEFDICVIPADGLAAPVVVVAGQNPSWSPNSRTLVFNRDAGHRQVLSVLDVFTKQYKDCARATGSNSQPAWAK